MESINPISTMIDLCKERNIIIPENVIRIYEENRRNRHLKLDCDEFAYKL